MAKYIIKRLVYAVFVLLGVATIVFFLVRLTGDPIAIMLPENATDEQAAELTESLGLDKPLIEQYIIYINNLIHLDFGTSLRYRTSNFDLILERLPATLRLAGTAMLFALLVAIPCGILAALKRGTFIDQSIMAISMACQAMPVFWAGILMIMLFSVKLGWLPTGGYGDGAINHIIMPAIALGLHLMALVMKLLRSSLIEVLGADYIRTAKAKGLFERRVVVKHAFRNSMLPVVTVIGIQMGALLGGSVVTETVFAWPGVGQLMVQAITYRDFSLVQACITLLAAVFVFVNLAVDILYVFIDPRISYA